MKQQPAGRGPVIMRAKRRSALDCNPARLSASLKRKFERDGYVILRNVLSPSEVTHFTKVVDRLAAEERRARSLGPSAGIEIRNAIARTHALLPLIDWPTTFPLVAEILGWNIQLTTSHVFLRMPTQGVSRDFKASEWHFDGPVPPIPDVNGTLPRLYAKIGYFLTDLSGPNRGNLRVIPGSHLSTTKPPIDPATGDPVGAIQVRVRPGDAVIFEQRLWHAVGPNYADYPRKNIYMGYCYRWLKAIDFLTQEPELLARATPIQRQLLGAATHELSYYLPHLNPVDIPLRDWMENHLR